MIEGARKRRGDVRKNPLIFIHAFSFLILISGGAVSAEASYLNVTNSMFYANIASGTGFGGAIYVSDTYVSSFTSVFDNNSGMFLLPPSFSFPLLSSPFLSFPLLSSPFLSFSLLYLLL